MALQKLKKGFFSGTSKIFDGTLEKLINSIIDAVNAGGGGSSATWDTLEGKPTVIAAGADQAAARQAIGAGTSNLAIGTTAETAKAGNYDAVAVMKAKSQIAGLTNVTAADATDEATAIALANANKAAINAVIAALKA
ncbi:hypothetical protein [Brucella intermedia]|uniref:hypothetical protein n=1 Tax=Brucella intermedia TaxID=94625 RepID=UPI00224B0174|nr:hypothetical protein [Brucella intermedia]